MTIKRKSIWKLAGLIDKSELTVYGPAEKHIICFLGGFRLQIDDICAPAIIDLLYFITF